MRLRGRRTLIQRWQIKNWAVAHKNLIAIALGFFLVLVFVGYWFGFTAKVSNWWYSRGTEAAHEEVDKARGEAAAAKAVAEEALKELALEKGRYEVERKKREIAEQILSDRSKNTDQKLAAYEKAINQQPTVSAPATSVDELCARARAAGIACE